MRCCRGETVPGPTFPHSLASLLLLAAIICAVLAGSRLRLRSATLRLPLYCGCADHYAKAQRGALIPMLSAR